MGDRKRVRDRESLKAWRDLLLSNDGPVQTPGLPGSTAALRLIGLLVSNFYDPEHDRLWALESVLAKKSGLSREWVGKLLGTLGAWGCLTRSRPKRGCKYFYRLTFPKSTEQGFTTPGTRTRVREGSEHGFGGVPNTGSPQVANTGSQDSETQTYSERLGGATRPPPLEAAGERVPQEPEVTNPTGRCADCEREVGPRLTLCFRCRVEKGTSNEKRAFRRGGRAAVVGGV